MPKLRRPSTTASKPRGAYRDFVIVARRLDSRKIGIGVDASPAGRLSSLVPVAFSEKECAEIHGRFVTYFGNSQIQGGKMLIEPTEASALGRRLAEVIFRPEVLMLFATSLASVARTSGLRIRLSMDPALLDLPWEYLLRPDRHTSKDAVVSDFLLLDPRISLVRQAADASISLPPISGRQRMAYIGTFWEGNRDLWEVVKEYQLLQEALEPVESFVQPTFAIASDAKQFSAKKLEGAAIFHYAGHCDLDQNGRAFLIRELPTTRPLAAQDSVYIDEIAPVLGRCGTRLVVLSACNSGYMSAAKPLLDAGVPVVVGINGGVASISTIEFCAKLYESLAVGLTLDEAMGRARLHVFEWGRQHNLFDWGLFMVHMTCPEAALFPRRATATVQRKQKSLRAAHEQTIGQSIDLVRAIDGLNFGEIMSQLTQRRVLILGRFSRRRLPLLKAIESHLKKHKNGYLPQLFTFEKPESRDLVEAIMGYAALSRFVIADLSEPKSIQQELEAIAPHFQSVPIVPLINASGREFATFESIKRRVNVVKPTIRYRSEDDLTDLLESKVVPLAENKLREVRPPGH